MDNFSDRPDMSIEQPHTPEDCYSDGYYYYECQNYDTAFRAFKCSADRGHSEAQFMVGLCYENGRGVDKDYVSAYKYYKLAAAQNAAARCNLGLCYELGRGVEKNNVLASMHYEFAARGGDAIAQCSLANCYEYSIGVPKNLERAFYYYDLSARQHNPRAQFHLGQCYEYGKGTQENKKQAFEYYKLAAEQKYVPAQFDLGYCYEYGIGTKVDKELAFKNYQLAAAQKHSEAQGRLGLCYEYGKGTAVDLKLAFENYQLAAAQKDKVAQRLLGLCYEHGKWTAVDLKLAFENYQFAAAQGDTVAQHRLGHCYAHGKGTLVNDELSFKNFKLAADNNDAEALMKLGLHYLHGIGVNSCRKSAIEAFKKAEQLGNSNAVVYLGLCYETTKIEQDIKEAIKQYTKIVGDNIFAQVNLGFCYEHGIGGPYPIDKAEDIYHLSANNKAYLEYMLGYRHEYAIGVSLNIFKALRHYERSSELASLDASLALRRLKDKIDKQIISDDVEFIKKYLEISDNAIKEIQDKLIFKKAIDAKAGKIVKLIFTSYQQELNLINCVGKTALDYALNQGDKNIKEIAESHLEQIIEDGLRSKTVGFDLDQSNEMDEKAFKDKKEPEQGNLNQAERSIAIDWEFLKHLKNDKDLLDFYDTIRNKIEKFSKNIKELDEERIKEYSSKELLAYCQKLDEESLKAPDLGVPVQGDIERMQIELLSINQQVNSSKIMRESLANGFLEQPDSSLPRQNQSNTSPTDTKTSFDKVDNEYDIREINSLIPTIEKFTLLDVFSQHHTSVKNIIDLVNIVRTIMGGQFNSLNELIDKLLTINKELNIISSDWLLILKGLLDNSWMSLVKGTKEYLEIEAAVRRLFPNQVQKFNALLEIKKCLEPYINVINVNGKTNGQIKYPCRKGEQDQKSSLESFAKEAAHIIRQLLILLDDGSQKPSLQKILFNFLSEQYSEATRCLYEYLKQESKSNYELLGGGLTLFMVFFGSKIPINSLDRQFNIGTILQSYINNFDSKSKKGVEQELESFVKYCDLAREAIKEARIMHARGETSEEKKYKSMHKGILKMAESYKIKLDNRDKNELENKIKLNVNLKDVLNVGSRDIVSPVRVAVLLYEYLERENPVEARKFLIYYKILECKSRMETAAENSLEFVKILSECGFEISEIIESEKGQNIFTSLTFIMQIVALIKGKRIDKDNLEKILASQLGKHSGQEIKIIINFLIILRVFFNIKHDPKQSKKDWCSFFVHVLDESERLPYFHKNIQLFVFLRKALNLYKYSPKENFEPQALKKELYQFLGTMKNSEKILGEGCHLAIRFLTSMGAIRLNLNNKSGGDFRILLLEYLIPFAIIWQQEKLAIGSVFAKDFLSSLKVEKQKNTKIKKAEGKIKFWLDLLSEVSGNLIVLQNEGLITYDIKYYESFIKFITSAYKGGNFLSDIYSRIKDTAVAKKSLEFITTFLSNKFGEKTPMVQSFKDVLNVFENFDPKKAQESLNKLSSSMNQNSLLKNFANPSSFSPLAVLGIANIFATIYYGEKTLEKLGVIDEKLDVVIKDIRRFEQNTYKYLDAIKGQLGSLEKNIDELKRNSHCIINELISTKQQMMKAFNSVRSDIQGVSARIAYTSQQTSFDVYYKILNDVGHALKCDESKDYLTLLRDITKQLVPSEINKNTNGYAFVNDKDVDNEFLNASFNEKKYYLSNLLGYIFQDENLPHLGYWFKLSEALIQFVTHYKHVSIEDTNRLYVFDETIKKSCEIINYLTFKNENAIKKIHELFTLMGNPDSNIRIMALNRLKLVAHLCGIPLTNLGETEYLWNSNANPFRDAVVTVLKKKLGKSDNQSRYIDKLRDLIIKLRSAQALAIGQSLKNKSKRTNTSGTTPQYNLSRGSQNNENSLYIFSNSANANVRCARG